MTKKSVIQYWCWCNLLVLFQHVLSSSNTADFMSVCGKTLNISSLSLILPSSTSPSTLLTCCNLTLVRSSLADSSEQITINILNISTIHPALKLYNKDSNPIEFFTSSSLNRSYFKSGMHQYPIYLSLCQTNIPPFEISIANISKGPCKNNQYLCLTTNEDQWCIDETYHCDGYHSCPQGMDEYGCTKPISHLSSIKNPRTFTGGVVTTIIIFGLLLIIGSVSLALAFVYIRRRNQRRRQLTYSLESTSDDWEPSGTGYHLFDNLTNNHRRTTSNRADQLIIDANEHLPIAPNVTNR